MPFLQGSDVSIAECRGGGPYDVKEQVYAHGKIGGVEQPDSAALHQIADAWDLAIPPGGSDDHVRLPLRAPFDIAQDGMWCGEVDDDIYPGQRGLVQPCSVYVFGLIQHGHGMSV